MPALWLILAGVSAFMLFFAITEMTAVFAMFLSAGWFGVFLLCTFEAIAVFRTRARRPSREEQQEAYYRHMVRLSARNPRR